MLTTEQKISLRYIPTGSREVKLNDLGVCYVSEPAGRFQVIAYTARAGKRSFFESYRSAERRDQRVADFFRGLEQHEALKAERREKAGAPHTLKPGDILHHSWGWEQTQCDYYQIIEVTAHGATIREIASQTVEGSTVSHGMADQRVAVRDAFTGEPIKVRIDGYNTVRKSRGPLSHGCCNLWDGRASYCSWYG